MNWYHQQKEALNWPGFLGGKPQPVQPKAQPAGRSKQQIDAELQRVRTQINILKREPNSAAKVQELQKQYQALLDESSQHYEMSVAV